MLSRIARRSRPKLRRILMLLLALAMMGLPLYVLPADAAQLHEPDPVRYADGARPLRPQLTVDEILARHYDAVGGDDHLQVQTMKTSGTSVVMGMESAYARYSKRPNKVLLEIYVQDMTGIQAFDGDTAWAYMPFMGQTDPAVMTPEQARAMREGADFDGPLVHAREKGHEVALQGVEQVRGRDAYKLELTLETGGVQTHYVDVETFYVTRVVSESSDAVMLDYRLVDGHPVPSVIEMTGPYGEQIIYIDDVEFGLRIDDDAFRMK